MKKKTKKQKKNIGVILTFSTTAPRRQFQYLFDEFK